jgi:hypothetical protein
MRLGLMLLFALFSMSQLTGTIAVTGQHRTLKDVLRHGRPEYLTIIDSVAEVDPG